MSEFEDTLNKLLSDPDQMEKLMGVAKSFMQPSDGDEESVDNGVNAGVANAASAISKLDPKMLGLIGKLMGEYSSGSDKDVLLHAIGPYLKGSRRNQFERATEMAKLARIAKLAMNEFGGGG